MDILVIISLILFVLILFTIFIYNDSYKTEIKNSITNKNRDVLITQDKAFEILFRESDEINKMISKDMQHDMLDAVFFTLNKFTNEELIKTYREIFKFRTGFIETYDRDLAYPILMYENLSETAEIIYDMINSYVKDGSNDEFRLMAIKVWFLTVIWFVEITTDKYFTDKVILIWKTLLKVNKDSRNVPFFLHEELKDEGIKCIEVNEQCAARCGKAMELFVDINTIGKDIAGVSKNVNRGNRKIENKKYGINNVDDKKLKNNKINNDEVSLDKKVPTRRKNIDDAKKQAIGDKQSKTTIRNDLITRKNKKFSDHENISDTENQIIKTNDKHDDRVDTKYNGDMDVKIDENKQIIDTLMDNLIDIPSKQESFIASLKGAADALEDFTDIKEKWNLIPNKDLISFGDYFFSKIFHSSDPKELFNSKAMFLCSLNISNVKWIKNNDKYKKIIKKFDRARFKTVMVKAIYCSFYANEAKKHKIDDSIIHLNLEKRGMKK